MFEFTPEAIASEHGGDAAGSNVKQYTTKQGYLRFGCKIPTFVSFFAARFRYG
jgi:hypothetical protein